MIEFVVLAPLALVAVAFLFAGRVPCGGYDPDDYRCGKCARCKEEA